MPRTTKSYREMMRVTREYNAGRATLADLERATVAHDLASDVGLKCPESADALAALGRFLATFTPPAVNPNRPEDHACDIRDALADFMADGLELATADRYKLFRAYSDAAPARPSFVASGALKAGA